LDRFFSPSTPLTRLQSLLNMTSRCINLLMTVEYSALVSQLHTARTLSLIISPYVKSLIAGMSFNRLQLNAGKTEAMWYATAHRV
jgi:hypothetical protein